MNYDQHVFVAMSGGVDSAVAVASLLDQGYRVTGIHMVTWKDPKLEAAVKDLPKPQELTEKTANALGIPLVILDVRDRFYENVVKQFIMQYSQGLTPNPCLFCNPQIKWGLLQSYAFAHGADFFATGHYARIMETPGGEFQLLKGLDPQKDQSYVLSMLSQYQLSRSILPLGEMTKENVRAWARNLSLPAADRQDSQDLCFLGDVNYRDFLERYAPDSLKIGEITDINGKVLGEHHGLAFFTIGQRKGIRIAASEPYFVIDKDTAHNRLIVGFADQAGKNSLIAVKPNWIADQSPTEGKIYDVMVRYRANPEPAELCEVTENQFRLKFENKLRGVTPGQVAVLYQGDLCLGGGIISSFD